ncbi:hypothetical protein N0V88_002023 [Collariella sp. IMI 366227]|nr:hypothetical protein N0V88_002023 [Collariella sp. IMI 366227]
MPAGKPSLVPPASRPLRALRRRRKHEDWMGQEQQQQQQEEEEEEEDSGLLRGPLPLRGGARPPAVIRVVLASALYGNDDDDDDDDELVLQEIERGILDVFSDAYCNKHLVYSILELVLVRLLPEIAEKGVLELWAERIPVE